MSKKLAGKYFGTEIDKKWWKRYTKNKMLARGNGTFSYDEQSISFLRLLTSTPIVIESEQIIEIQIGKWHAGQWGSGKPILKIMWKKGNQLLSSGFSVKTESGAIKELVSELSNILNLNK